MSGSRIALEALEDGRVLHLTLSAPPGNVLDLALVEELRGAVRTLARREPHAVIVSSAGPNFSLGASVQDHLPERIGPFLSAFHSLVRELLDRAPPMVAAVRGFCLGGGLELALLAQRIVAAPSSRLGVPEIQLGVFAPVASLLLAMRVGQPAADDLLLTGRHVPAPEALAMKLVDELADEPVAAALHWIREHLLKLSRSSLRFAAQVARTTLADTLRARLDAVESLYLRELMRTRDAVEGVRAFLEKRPPKFGGA
jgi:cyclohexa-1,5-dienecarbonyl-CoA hydratase